MIISLIAAMSENRVIGSGNAIPWNIPSDQKRFREITMGHSVIFGRLTYESIGRPLSGRKNIVLTRQADYHAPGIIVAHGLTEAFSMCQGEDEVFIGGGGTVFSETIALAHRIYLAVIHQSFSGDTFFPVLPPYFSEAAREEVRNTLPYSFIRYERYERDT